MAAIPAKNTRPEKLLRSHLFRRGMRYRIHVRTLPGKPDIVFPGARVAVFVDGDFWHGLGWKERGLLGLPDQFPTRKEFWVAKITRNVERDREVTAALERQGWLVLRVLTSEVTADVVRVCDMIATEVSRHRDAQGVGPR